MLASLIAAAMDVISSEPLSISTVDDDDPFDVKEPLPRCKIEAKRARSKRIGCAGISVEYECLGLRQSINGDAVRHVWQHHCLKWQ